MSVAGGDAGDGDEMSASPGPVLRHGVPVSMSRGQEVLHPDRGHWIPLATALFDEGYLVAVDLTAVDYLTHPGRPLPDGVTPERFEVVVSLLSHTHRSRVRLRVQVPADDAVLTTLTAIFPGVDAAEREVFDLFGITFDGHPDMTRIVMPEDWVGHPLRKDYDSGRIPVQFKGPAPSR